VRKAGREPHPDDLPPALEWESEIWELWRRIETQWRCDMDGPVGLDYNPAIAIIRERRWPIEPALELLQAIELTVLKKRKRAHD